MSQQHSSSSSVQAVGAVRIIKASTSLAGDALNHCQQSVDDCLAQRRALIILDMSDCPLINSQGLEFIVTAQEACLARGGKLVLAEPQALCEEVLHITGVDQCVAVFDNIRAALGDFAH